MDASAGDHLHDADAPQGADGRGASPTPSEGRRTAFIALRANRPVASVLQALERAGATAAEALDVVEDVAETIYRERLERVRRERSPGLVFVVVGGALTVGAGYAMQWTRPTLLFLALVTAGLGMLLDASARRTKAVTGRRAVRAAIGLPEPG